jgi:hypothetical protein
MKKLLSVLLCCASAGACASLVNATYSWTGVHGWSASGSIRYDDSIMHPTASGSLWGPAYSIGIEYLDLAIFDAAGAAKGSWVQIANYVPTYSALSAELDSATDALRIGSEWEVGKDTFNYFGGTPGTELVISWNRKIVDSATGLGSRLSFVVQEPEPQPIPAPGPGWLLLAWFPGIVAAVRRRRGLDARA